MKRILITLAGSVLMLSGCVSTMTAAPAGQFTVKNSASLTLIDSWTHVPENLNSTKGSAFTKDGVSLNKVHVVTIEDGEKLINSSDKSQEFPTYQAGSSELQQIEFLTSSLSRIGTVNLKPRNVTPKMVGGLEGVQFELDGKYESGLNMKGLAVLTESNAGLNIIVYIAPAAHYYEKDLASVKSLIASAQFPS